MYGYALSYAGRAFSTRGTASPEVMRSTYATPIFVRGKILDASLTARMEIIIIGSFNVAAAVLMIAVLLYHGWKARRRNLSYQMNYSPTWFPKPRQKRFDLLPAVHSADAFSLIISVAVVLQGMAFILIQTQGLKSNSEHDCTRDAQVVWPAIWIVPYTSLVFGLETCFRSLQRNPFRPQGRWHVPICIAVIAVLVLLTWVATKASPAKGECLASLIGWTADYAVIGIATAGGIILVFIISTIVIGVQLRRNLKVDRAERIAASRLLFYLVTNIVILTLVLPYYIQSILHRSALLSAHIADIALNVSGITNGILYIFLRSNVDLTSIRPAVVPWSEERSLRTFDASNLTPVSSMSQKLTASMEEGSSYREQVENEMHEDILKSSLETVPPLLGEPGLDYTQPYHVHVYPPTTLAQHSNTALSRRSTQHKSKYSLYPATVQEMTHVIPRNTPRSSAEVSLRPPSPLFSRRHKRDWSEGTSASVPIGLRLSPVRDTYPGTVSPVLPLHHRQSSLQPGSVPPFYAHPGPRKHPPSKVSERSMDITIEYSGPQPGLWQHRAPNPVELPSPMQVRKENLALHRERSMKALPPIPRRSSQGIRLQADGRRRGRPEFRSAVIWI